MKIIFWSRSLKQESIIYRTGASLRIVVKAEAGAKSEIAKEPEQSGRYFGVDADFGSLILF